MIPGFMPPLGNRLVAVASSTIYDNDFSTDADIANWTLGQGAINGTRTISGGTLRYTVGSSDGNFPRVVRTFTGLTNGKNARFVFVLNRTQGTASLLWGTASNGNGNPFIGLAGTGQDQNVVAAITATTMTLAMQLQKIDTGDEVFMDTITITEEDP